MKTAYPKVYVYKRMVQAKLFMDAHYASPLLLKTISGEACFSAFHFIRVFKKIYGRTPHQYLVNVRLQKAESLLRKGCTVSEACYAVGFESLGSFSRLFKRTTGLAPSVYLGQQQRRMMAMRQEPLYFIPGCFAEKKGWKQKGNFEEAAL